MEGGKRVIVAMCLHPNCSPQTFDCDCLWESYAGSVNLSQREGYDWGGTFKQLGGV